MMNKMLLLAGVTATVIATNANAADFSQYVAVRGIYSDVDVKATETYSVVTEYYSDSDSEKGRLSDHSWGGSLAYGVKFGSIRGELEANLFDEVSKTDDEDWKDSIKHRSVMFNAYYDFDTGTRFTPYYSVGLGYAHLKYEGKDSEDSISKSANNLAWQVGAGLSYAITNNALVDLGYRYTNYGSFTYKESESFEGGSYSAKLKGDVTSNEFYLGLRYQF